MPLLGRRSQEKAADLKPGAPFPQKMGTTSSSDHGCEYAQSPPSQRRPGLFETCANPQCKSGWLHVWRSRTAPIFEAGWTCSPECTSARIQAAVARELDGRATLRTVRRHRIPLGLLMLEKGWISQSQLRQALDAQRSAGTGRLGSWLVRQNAVSEETITRALALQWSCPVMSPDNHEPATIAAVMPRLFVDALGALPLRVAASQVLYLGFEESLDQVLAFAIARMTGLRVETGIVQESLFRPAHTKMLEATFAPVELVEAVSPGAAAQAFAKSVERTKPIASRLVRVHDCLWLRMWLSAPMASLPEIGAVRDIVCSIGPI
jgi:Type II secretion system (T2SS), protein E, N-terminal domain